MLTAPSQNLLLCSLSRADWNLKSPDSVAQGSVDGLRASFQNPRLFCHIVRLASESSESKSGRKTSANHATSIPWLVLEQGEIAAELSRIALVNIACWIQLRGRPLTTF